MRSVRNAPKRAINLNLNRKVLDMARAMGLNAEAIAHCNERSAREGLFSDRYRTLMRPRAERKTAWAMARFDLHTNPLAAERSHTPFDALDTLFGAY